jgi:hypothetical protein
MRAYFNIANLFNDSDVNDGSTFSLYLQTIKVNGVEQLTSDYFAEVLDNVYINPHTSNAWEFSNCSQSGTYPSTTLINACALGGVPNTWNPFADAFKVDYSSTVNGVKRGEITTSVSGNFYGLEQFRFGFDKTYVPINDAIGGSNGSTGASLDGAFYIEYDDTQDLSIVLSVKKKDSLGAIVYRDTHTYEHDSTNCSFSYNAITGGSVVDSKQIAFLSGGLSGWIVPKCVQLPCQTNYGSQGNVTEIKNIFLTNGGTGSLFSFPNGSGTGKQFLEVNTSTGIISYFGTDYNCTDQVFASNGLIYALNTTASGDRIIKLDPVTKVITPINIGTAPETNSNRYGEPVAFGNFIYWCPASFFSTDILKFDIINETYTMVSTPSGGTSRYAGGILGSNDRIYWFPRSSTSGNEDILVCEPLNSDNVYKVGSVAIYADRGVVEVSGTIYAFPQVGTNIIKVVPNPTGETISSLDKSADLAILPPSSYHDAVVGIDGNVYAAPFLADSTMKFDVSTETITFQNPQIPKDSYYKYGALGDDGLIYWLQSDIDGTVSANGLLYFFDTPNCGSSVSTSPIVTQSLGLPASTKSAPVTLFDDLKGCCYFSPVFGDLSDPVSYKNDINGFLFKRDFSSETIDYVLLKNGGALNGGTDIPMTNNDYGTYYNFGSFASYPDYKGYQVEWRNVLNLEGEGDYQIQVTSNLVTGTFVDTSIPFRLRAYTPERVHGTVRIQSIMNGYLRDTDFNYKGLNWLDGIRFEGMFGNRQAEYDEERIIYQNRQVKQLRSELINKYNLKSMHLPSCITDVVIQYHNLSNKMLITDYNSINHKTYIDTEVILDSVNSIEYPVVANTAPLDITYKDYTQNHNKSNC